RCKLAIRRTLAGAQAVQLRGATEPIRGGAHMRRMLGSKAAGSWLALTTLTIALAAGPARAGDPPKVSPVAPPSGQSAASGEPIPRGSPGAIDEITARGGVLGGRMFELIRRDDESNPSKGVTAAREMIFKEHVAAMFGGLDSPVSLAIVPLANAEK